MLRALKWSGAFLVCAVAAITCFGAVYIPSSAIPAGFAGKHVRVHGIPVRVLQQGSGPDVLLIHGSPGSVEDWSSVMPALKGEARLTAYDRPGNGFSGVTGDYSLAHNADVAQGVIDALGLRDVVVVGHSYGGATALALALREPKHVAAYVILDSATYTPSREVTALYRLLLVPGLGTGLARLSGGSVAAQKIEAGIREQFNGREPPAGFVALRTRIWSNPKVTRTIAEETSGARNFLAAQHPRYGEIQAPVRIVAQAENPFRRDTAKRLHAAIPGSTLRLLPGTGHYVQFERSAEVVDEIRAALATHARKN